MKLIQKITLATLCAMFVSCIQLGSHENSRFMQQAVLWAELKPDSALTMLDSVNTKLLSKEEKAEYRLLRIAAKDIAGLSISTEPEIFQVREYFIKRKDWRKAALACFYAGKAVAYMSMITMEIDYYLEGLEYAKQAKDELLQGKILYNMGFRKFDRIWNHDIITQYQLACSIYQTSNSPHQHEIYLLISIGNIFTNRQKADSALHYFNEALNIAIVHDDHSMQALTYTKMMEAFKEMELFDAAKYYGMQALRWAIADADKADIYKNFAHIFYQENSIDSARYYIVKAESFFANVNILYELVDFYYIYCEIEKGAGNFAKALACFELYTNCRIEMTNRIDFQKLLEFQKKYEIAETERKYYQEKRGIWRFISLLGFLSIFLFWCVISIRYKNIILKKVLSVLKKEKEEIVLKLQEQQDKYKKRHIKTQTLFLKKLGILKEITLINSSQKPNINVSLELNRVKSSLTMQSFIETTNELYPGFTDKLQNAFPCITLSEHDIAICCLILCEFSNQDLAQFVYKKKDTASIAKWKTRFRKKLGIPDHGNLRSFLLDKIAQIE